MSSKICLLFRRSATPSEIQAQTSDALCVSRDIKPARGGWKNMADLWTAWVTYASFVCTRTHQRESYFLWGSMKRMPMKTGDGDSSGIPSNVPAFLVKLWKLVEDPQYEEHISWNKVSKLFCFHFYGLRKRFYTYELHSSTFFLYYE